MPIKPLGIKAYGSIAHLPNSRLGPTDRSISIGQANICTVRVRDKNDLVIVQEKLDGSNVAVALVDAELLPLTRAGYLASDSPYVQHHMFADWVYSNRLRFLSVLKSGERICGEWLAQAHGTIYDCSSKEPFVAFDIIAGQTRKTFHEFSGRVEGYFQTPALLHKGGAISVDKAIELHRQNHYPCDSIEGVVYRVERFGRVDFLAKYVLPDKVDGKYLESVTGGPAVWNWLP